MSIKNTVQYSIIGVIGVSIIAWILISSLGRTDAEPLDMLPNDAAMIFQVQNPGTVFKTLEEDNSVWRQLLKIQSIAGLAEKIKSVDSILREDKSYSELLSSSQLTIGLYPDSIRSVNWLILSKIEYNPDIERLKRLLSTSLGRDYAILKIAGIDNSFKIVGTEKETTIYIAFVDGVLAVSGSPDILFRVDETYNDISKRLSNDLFFTKLKQSARSKVSAKMFVQYRYFSRLVAGVVNEDKYEFLDWIGDLAIWTESDILIKDNEVILSGFTISGDESNLYSCFAGQKPVKIDATNILPYNTNTLLWVGVGDFNSYFESSGMSSNAELISKRVNYDISKLTAIVGDEIFMVSNAESVNAFANSTWIGMKIKNSNNAKSILDLISRNTGNKRFIKRNNIEIGKINDSSILPDLFGKAFSGISNNYYTIIDDYVVFANSERSLVNFAGYIETGKTLDLNENFNDFSDNISSNSNLFIYVNPNNIKNRLNQFFNKETSVEFIRYENVLESFQGLSYQLSVGDPLSFTSLYTKESGVLHEESLALWKVQLDTDIVSGPFLVSDHRTRKKNIIVFDANNNMYLIDSDGHLMWKKKIDGKPLSDIYEIDFYKNRKIQYIFNTDNNIYLVDRNGSNVTGYPRKLHSKATNGLVVFDYLKNKDYRLLIAQSDKKIYNYSKKGNEIQGWSRPRMQNIVVSPVNRLVANRKDYIIVTDIENEVKIVDRKGNIRIRIAENLEKGKNSDYYVNKTNSKGIIITTDKTGKLVYISSSGKLNYTDFGSFSPNHFFLYEDFDGDLSKDFIFIDGNEIKVFDRFKKVLFSYSFDSEINIKPKFFELGTNEHVLGVVSGDERTIYLFDNKGNIIISKGLIGETPFTVGHLENNTRINLISGAGNTLYNYRLR